MSLSSASLKVHERVTALGMVEQLADRWILRPVLGPRLKLTAGELSSRFAVDLHAADGHEHSAGLHSVTGLWDGRAIRDAYLRSVPEGQTSLSPPESIGTRCEVDLQGVDEREAPARPDEAAAEVQALTDDGRLLQISAISHQSKSHWIAAVSDVAAVRDVLDPYFGKWITYVHCNWNRATLNAISQVLLDNGDEVGLILLGQGMVFDGRVRVSARICQLSENVATKLQGFPVEALELQTWILPLESEHAHA